MVFKRDVQPSRFSEWAWQDALFGGMVLASLVGLVYAFTRR
jgi:hypothetical protein